MLSKDDITDMAVPPPHHCRWLCPPCFQRGPGVMAMFVRVKRSCQDCGTRGYVYGKYVPVAE